MTRYVCAYFQHASLQCMHIGNLNTHKMDIPFYVSHHTRENPMKPHLTITLVITALLFASAYTASAGFNVGGLTRKAVKAAADEVSKAADDSTTTGEDSTADPDALVKRAKTELRAAQRNMYNGKKEEADEQLKNARSLIDQVTAADPENKNLKTLNNQYDRTRKDLDKRMGKSQTTPSSATTATEPEDTTAAPSRPSRGSRASSRSRSSAADAPAVKAPSPVKSSGKLPYHARQKMREFDNQFRSVEYSLRKMEEAKEGDTTTPPEQYAEEVKKALPQLQEILDEAKKEAGDHPDITAAQEKLDAIPEKLAAISGEVKAAQDKRAASTAEIAKDIDVLKKEYDRLYKKIFSKATGTPIYYNDLKPVNELIVVIDDYEKNDKSKAEEILASFSEKYGETRDEVTENTDDSQAGWDFEKLKKGVENVAKTRVAMAEDLAEKITQKCERLPSLHDFYRIKEHGAVKEWLAAAEKYAPDNEKVVALKESLEKTLSEDLAKLKEKIAEQKWPEHAANAPKDARKLAKAAMEWFKSAPGWGTQEKEDKEPYEILGVAITGPWSVQKQNVLGEPIMYGLPVKVAVQRKADKEQGLARVFILTLRTFEGRDVKKEPPFDYPTVGDSYFILAKNVK